MNALDIGKNVFLAEIETLKKQMECLDETFVKVLEEIMACKGKIMITGMGKSGHIARKMAATMSSLGTCAIFIHPGECMHGDLGMIQKNDLVIAISYSGESDEIIRIIPSIKLIGSKIIGITCNPNSYLAQKSDLVQVFPEVKEACHLGLAPTNSTTLVLVYGDALAVAASKIKGFTKKDFGVYHPAGSLGKALVMKVKDFLIKMEISEYLYQNDTYKQAIIILNKMGTDIIPVMDEQVHLVGIISNGAIERKLELNVDIYQSQITAEVNRYPVFVDIDDMAIDALRIMEKNHIKAVPVLRDNKVIGVVTKESIISRGIYIN